SRNCCSVTWPPSPLRSTSTRQNRSHGYSTTNIACEPVVIPCPRRRDEGTRRHIREGSACLNRSRGWGCLGLTSGPLVLHCLRLGHPATRRARRKHVK